MDKIWELRESSGITHHTVVLNRFKDEETAFRRKKEYEDAEEMDSPFTFEVKGPYHVE